MPANIFPKAITPDLETQVNAFETIADLENVDCSETAQYNSNYTSPMLQYLKGEITIDDFFENVRDTSIVEPDAFIKSEQLSIFTAS